MNDCNQRTNVPSYQRTTGISGLYAIADSGWNPCGTLAALAEKFLEGGCRIVQLRMKPPLTPPSPLRREGETSFPSPLGGEPACRQAWVDGEGGLVARVSHLASQMVREALAIKALKARYDFTFIVNDHAEIAAHAGADGVHVGEHDTPVRELRRRYGKRLLIGYSSHSIEEARRAMDDGADYVAFGAIFPTKTKGPGHPVQGRERLAELVQSVRVPVVAIGGIGRDNVRQVMEAGAGAVAMITALSQAPDVVAETKWFVETMRNHPSPIPLP